MDVKRMNLRNGTCNFCEKGELKTKGEGLEYPYSEVTEISGRCIGVRICDECKSELVDKLTTNQ